MVKFMIMSWLLGFSGNKLFAKDKRTCVSVRWGCISLAVLLAILYLAKQL